MLRYKQKQTVIHGEVSGLRVTQGRSIFGLDTAVRFFIGSQPVVAYGRKGKHLMQMKIANGDRLKGMGNWTVDCPSDCHCLYAGLEVLVLHEIACLACGGNGSDVPCLYPGEGVDGCLVKTD